LGEQKLYLCGCVPGMVSCSEEQLVKRKRMVGFEHLL
jgi:hypothetical protein